MTVRAISLSRPWPAAFLRLGKRIENRSRKDGRMPSICRYRGELYLHAAKSWDRGAGDWIGRHFPGRVPTHMLVDGQEPRLHPKGAIVGHCRAIGHVEPAAGRAYIVIGDSDPRTSGMPGCHSSDTRRKIAAVDDAGHELAAALDLRWWMGGYALVLTDVQPTSVIPCRGALGTWRVPTNVLEQLRVNDG